MQDLLNSYDAQLEALDNELSKPGDEPTKRGYRIKKAEIAKKRERLLAKFPDLETTYVDVGEGQQAATDDLMEAIYNSVADDLTEQKRADLVNMVEEYERKNGVTTKTTALKKKIKKTATDTEKETERANANKAIDKALEDVDYVSLQKKGSYTRSVKVNGKLYTVEIKDGVASCNGVKREW
jgi:predicted metal-dependent hydrolase